MPNTPFGHRRHHPVITTLYGHCYQGIRVAGVFALPQKRIAGAMGDDRFLTALAARPPRAALVGLKSLGLYLENVGEGRILPGKIEPGKGIVNSPPEQVLLGPGQIGASPQSR